MVTISKSDFILHQIDESCYPKWEREQKESPSDFESKGLKWIGDALREPGTQDFWIGGSYCWYTDKTQTRTDGVFVTNNGIICLIRDNKLYRVEFK